MAKESNYLIQARQAKERFLTYDQQAITRKLRLMTDSDYIYVNLLCQPYRLHRHTGNLERQTCGTWTDANSYEEVMTLLDLLCDSREDRSLSGNWKSMQSFGLMFHRDLLEEKRDPWAERFQRDPEALRRACLALGGQVILGGDVSYSIELFDGLRIGLQFWEGDEEFPPRLRYLWDENALMYIKYETMYFAITLLLHRLSEEM